MDTHPTARSLGDDFRAGFAQASLWRFLARREIARQYDRTAIGVFWIPLNILFHVAILGLVYSAVLGASKNYFSYFALSYSIWTTFGRTLSESSTLWRGSEKFLKQFSTPISTFINKCVYKLLLIFLISLPVGFAIALITGTRPGLHVLLVLPGIVVYFANIYWVVTVLSIASLRFRDLSRFMPNIVFLVYLTTPILWQIDRLGEDKQWIAQANPIFHLISLVRDPLLGTPAPTLSWMVCLTTAIVGNLVAFWTLKAFRWRIPLWL